MNISKRKKSNWQTDQVEEQVCTRHVSQIPDKRITAHHQTEVWIKTLWILNYLAVRKRNRVFAELARIYQSPVKRSSTTSNNLTFHKYHRRSTQIKLADRR